MLTTGGPPTVGGAWFDRQSASSSWSSIGISMLATAALFASAAIAIRSAPTWFELRPHVAEPPMVVHLSPPIAVPAPRRVAAPPTGARPARPTPPAPVVAPTTAPVGVTAEPAPVVAAPRSAPIATIPLGPPRDSSSMPGAAPTLPLAPTAASQAGSAITAAGFTWHLRLTKAQRDSINRAKAAGWAADLKGPIDGEARAQIEQSQHNAAMLHTSATGAGGGSGNTPGKGMDGVGAVQPGSQSAGAGGATNTTLVSIPFPLFYPGPSPQQRKRDSIVNADNLARMARLRARVDSLRRADSLAKVHADSLAKVRIIP